MESKIILEYRTGKFVNATVNTSTQEVKFDGKAVTGKMYMVFPRSSYIEIVKEGGKYYLHPAA